jgi:hypothetical protein
MHQTTTACIAVAALNISYRYANNRVSTKPVAPRPDGEDTSYCCTFKGSLIHSHTYTHTLATSDERTHIVEDEWHGGTSSRVEVYAHTIPHRQPPFPSALRLIALLPNNTEQTRCR